MPLRYNLATQHVSGAILRTKVSLLLTDVFFLVVSARDAWIQADENRYNGANKCTLFKAFASRGLGLNADATFTDNTDVPAGC